MKIGIEPRRDFLRIYTIANIYSIVYVLVHKEFLGLPASILIDVDLSFFLFSFLFVCSYYLCLFPVFNLLSKINFSLPHIYKSDEPVSSVFGIIVLALQFLYFLLIVFFDAGKVGVENVQVPFAKIWAFLQIDFVATYYLVSGGVGNIYRANGILFAVSNIMRGWTGFLMVLVFIYFIRRKSKLYLSFRYILLGLLSVGLFIPLVLFLKFLIRMRQSDVQLDSFVEVAFGYSNYFDFLIYSFEHTINRIQQFTLTWFAWDSSALLSRAYADGLIRSYISENLYGNFLLKIFELSDNPNLGVFLTQYIPYDFDVTQIEFNVSPGLVGWIAVVGSDILGFVLFLILAAILGFLLVQFAYRRGTEGWYRLISILWLMWLLLLLPGWLNQFVASIHALFIYLIIGFFSNRFQMQRHCATVAS